MEQALTGGGRRKRPSDTQQPEYREHCWQCERPITGNRDHAGRFTCESDIRERVSSVHCSKEEYERIEGVLRDQALIAGMNPLTKGSLTCGAARPYFSGNHVHTCEHPGGHFGFHECSTCRHLW